jgi:hypothetical protein
MQPLDWIVGIGRTWWAQSSMAESGTGEKQKNAPADENAGLLICNYIYFKRLRIVFLASGRNCAAQPIGCVLTGRR